MACAVEPPHSSADRRCDWLCALHARHCTHLFIMHVKSWCFEDRAHVANQLAFPERVGDSGVCSGRRMLLGAVCARGLFLEHTCNHTHNNQLAVNVRYTALCARAHTHEVNNTCHTRKCTPSLANDKVCSARIRTCSFAPLRSVCNCFFLLRCEGEQSECQATIAACLINTTQLAQIERSTLNDLAGMKTRRVSWAKMREQICAYIQR
jgi:hypothetical protein